MNHDVCEWLFRMYYMCDCTEMNGKGRVRRRPGTAVGPKVTHSTWDAYIQGGTQGIHELSSRWEPIPQASVRPPGRHGRACLLWWFFLFISELCQLYYLHMLCTIWVFLLGFGSRVLRVAGKSKESVNRPWVWRAWGRRVHVRPARLLWLGAFCIWLY